MRGFQVAPAELEGVLLGHEAIADAAVVGVPYLDGEAPRAYVVPKAGAMQGKALEAEIQDYIAARLSSYKKLTAGVEFIAELPRNANGKVLKKVLKESFFKKSRLVKL